MNYPVLLNPDCEHLGRVQEAIDVVNHLQPYFRLTLVEAKWLPNSEKDEIGADGILRLVQKNYSQEPTIVVIQNPFTDNYFAHKYRQTYIITNGGLGIILCSASIKGLFGLQVHWGLY